MQPITMVMKKWSDVLKAKPPDLGEKLNIRDESILYNTPQHLIEHHHFTTPEIDKRIADLEHRSMVFRRLPPGTTCEHIVQAEYNSTTDEQPTWITAQFETQILQVMRDSMDPRRFVITFNTLDDKRRMQARTLRINGTVIRPTKGDFHGYIPEIPYYLQEEDYRTLLAPYGNLEEIRFNTLKNNTQRTNGLHFSITLQPVKKVPDVINFEGVRILIVNKDSRKRCTFCHNYGHLAYQCQKRKQQRITNLEARAEIEAMNEDNAWNIDPTLNPPAGSRNSNASTVTSQSCSQHQPPHQVSPSGTSFPRTSRPTPSKRASPENGHIDMTIPKRGINSKVNALFEEFATDDRMDESGSGETSISEDEYKHYVGRRRRFATAARSEVVAEHYPGKNFDSLSKGEWQTIDEKINARFRELLISKFPDKHYQLNLLYLSKRQGDFKPP